MLDVKLIRRSFSRASTSYDSNAFLQKRIGLELLETIKAGVIKPQRILDIGLGTGWLSEELAHQFKVGVFGVDSAIGMVLSSRKRRGVKALAAEAQQLPFKNNSFDCIISNLAFQWVPNLAIALKEAARVLKRGKNLYLSCFGIGTLKELKLALNSTPGSNFSFSGFQLPTIQEIESRLADSGFKKISPTSEIINEDFKDMFSLLKWLKAIGANSLAKPKFVKRSVFLRANNFYKENFKSNGQIYASFNLIRVRATK